MMMIMTSDDLQESWEATTGNISRRHLPNFESWEDLDKDFRKISYQGLE